MTQQKTPQILVPAGKRIMTMPLAIVVYACYGASQSLLGCLTHHDPHASARSLPDMRQAEEVKRTTIMLVTLTSAVPFMAEIHNTSLHRVQRKAILAQPLVYGRPETFAIVAILEHTDRVIGVPHRLSASVLPPLPIRRRFQRINNFGAQSHGFSTCCLRFTSGIATRHARLACRWW